MTTAPPMSNEWLAEEDDGPCPDCGFAVDRNVLVRVPDSADRPCNPCLWAHEPPREDQP